MKRGLKVFPQFGNILFYPYVLNEKRIERLHRKPRLRRPIAELKLNEKRIERLHRKSELDIAQDLLNEKRIESNYSCDIFGTSGYLSQ